MSDALLPTLDWWSEQRGRAVTWVLKGQNNRTEMCAARRKQCPPSPPPAPAPPLPWAWQLASAVAVAGARLGPL